MKDKSLRTFFAPSAIAVVGATEDQSRFGGKVMQRLRQFGASGEVFPVNPSSQVVNGLKCYPSIRDLPRAPEHVGIMVPATRVFDVLDDCAALGVPFATVFSAGFAETGEDEGRKRQARLADFARDTGIRILGPNCNGFVNFVDGFAFTSTGTVAAGRAPAGRIALVAQSGGAAQVNVMWRAQQMGLGLSYEVSCGNSADLDILAFMDFMVDDPHTDVIMVMAEVLKDGKRLLEIAARAASAGKPIVMLKLGRSEAGTRAAVSHTGALTGSNEAHDAAFRQSGIIRVDDCNELYEVAMQLQTKRLPAGRSLAALSASGGNAVLMADLGGGLGMTWPPFEKATQDRLGEVLPKHGQANNPVDVTSAAIGGASTYRRCIEAIAADSNIDAVVPILTMAAQSDIEQVSAAIRDLDKPGAILWTGGCNNNPSLTPRTLIEQGVPVYRDAHNCLKALNAAAGYASFVRKSRAANLVPSLAAGQVAKAKGLLASFAGVAGESDARRVLELFEFKAPKEGVAGTGDEAARLAQQIGGAVALKISSPQIVHKTEAGGVALNIAGEVAVRRAFEQIVASAKAHNPNAVIEGVLVQGMAPADGIDMILGVAPDQTFGRVVMVGLGGIHVEVLKDVAFGIPPFSPAEALTMLRGLRAFPILEGVRGQEPYDIDALCQAVSTLSSIAAALQDDIAEVDINPLRVYPKGRGVQVIDAIFNLVPKDHKKSTDAAALAGAAS
ncbi:MAG TPA: acetate--CoA ligase family protein [Pseudolabrys sp.]